MISRSAYAQLRYSPVLLAGTIAGMALTYVAPGPAGAFRGRCACRCSGMADMGDHGRVVHPDPAVLPAVALRGGWRFRLSRWVTWRSRSTRRISTRKAAADCWKGRAQAYLGGVR